MKLSIIIPVLNEAREIESCLKKLKRLRDAGHEIIVVDGGSQDATVKLAEPLCDQFIKTKAARSLQMNAGAKQACGDFLLFLHVDTFLPKNIGELVKVCEPDKDIWGRFDVQLSGKALLFRIIEKCMNLRSRLTGIATGDQVIFVNKKLFEKIGKYPEIALMEDIAISKKLNKESKPICLRQKVLSSSRRWEQNGIIRTIIKMWLLRLLYFFNYDTHKLAEHYQ